MIVFGLKNLADVRSLGSAFGTHFLGPLIFDAPGPQTWVIGAYGPPRSGKSTFFEAAGAACGQKGNMWDWHKQDTGFTVRHWDFGIQIDFTGRSDLYGFVSRQKLPKPQRKPGFDFLEHPPLQYIQRPAVLVVAISKESLNPRSKESLNPFTYFPSLCVRLMQLCENAQQLKSEKSTSRLAQLILPQVDIVNRRFSDLSANKDYGGIFSIALLADDKAARSAFNVFRDHTAHLIVA